MMLFYGGLIRNLITIDRLNRNNKSVKKLLQKLVAVLARFLRSLGFIITLLLFRIEILGAG